MNDARHFLDHGLFRYDDEATSLYRDVEDRVREVLRGYRLFKDSQPFSMSLYDITKSRDQLHLIVREINQVFYTGFDADAMIKGTKGNLRRIVEGIAQYRRTGTPMPEELPENWGGLREHRLYPVIEEMLWRFSPRSERMLARKQPLTTNCRWVLYFDEVTPDDARHLAADILADHLCFCHYFDLNNSWSILDFCAYAVRVANRHGAPIPEF